MHKSAFNNALKFYKKYCINNTNKTILDIGSWDGGNGSLRQIFNDCQYTGLDIQAGPNVDIIADAHRLPFENSTFDIIVSSSCFEHDQMFWITFLEMCRVIKPSGLMYICAPSSGPYHPEKCPSDSWRFYPDAWKSLCVWANYNHHSLILLESYIDQSNYPPDSDWKDSIGIFKYIGT